MISKAFPIAGPITRFPADDLRHAKRLITTHNAKGKGVFLPDDDGDHHKIMLNGQAAANIIYSTQGAQVDLNNEQDIKFAKENEASPILHMRTNLRQSLTQRISRLFTSAMGPSRVSSILPPEWSHLFIVPCLSTMV